MSLFQPSELMNFLESIGRKPNKTLSQNFLVDGNILRKIIQSANIKKGDLVLEIGPGPGALTEAILLAGARVIAVEKDSVFAKHLPRLSSEDRFLEVHEEDILEFDIPAALKNHLSKGEKAKVIANLPYHLTSPIFDKLLPLSDLIDEVIVMIQKEVAIRICSKKGSKDYSSFSIFCQLYSDPEYLFSVSPNCFYPKPNVTSAIIRCKLTHRDLNVNKLDFVKFIKKLFGTRRKMITSTLKDTYAQDKVISSLQSLGLNIKSRPEELSIDELINFYQSLNL